MPDFADSINGWREYRWSPEGLKRFGPAVPTGVTDVATVVKKIVSQRTAAKLLGIGRPALTALIVSKQVTVTMVNGIQKIAQSEVDRLATEGWDVDKPIPANKKKSAPKIGAVELGDSILKLKI